MPDALHDICMHPPSTLNKALLFSRTFGVAATLCGWLNVDLSIFATLVSFGENPRFKLRVFSNTSCEALHQVGR